MILYPPKLTELQITIQLPHNNSYSLRVVCASQPRWPHLTLLISCAAQSSILGLTTIIGIAVAGVAIVILMFLIILVSLCICRFNANRQGFYITEEDKTANPPSMLRYSASLRSISSQAVVPIIDGKGQLAEKENEFYV